LTKPEPYTPIEWRDGRVRYLDQTHLPNEEIVRETADWENVVSAIKRLAIRGAPLIGIAAAYAVVLAAMTFRQRREKLERAIQVIGNARPTAVNLSSAASRMLSVLPTGGAALPVDVPDLLLVEARRIHEEERHACEAISLHGVSLFSRPIDVLTICNTGPLATGGIGTAFGILHTAWSNGLIRRVYACETRPLLQGARLTIWECMKHGIPATLINDSAAGHLMQTGKVGAVVTGADRIAMNGDVANKIGTYMLAVLCEAHRIPFYTAAPSSSVDVTVRTGENIVIEERSADEITMFQGKPIAPSGTHALAPAFDFTPARFITAIVTERGIHRKPFQFDSREQIAGPGTS
jgi:methylthioribose-1-phosphate isomerase